MGNKRTEREKAVKEFKSSKDDFSKLTTMQIFLSGFNRGFNCGKKYQLSKQQSAKSEGDKK